jgi:hypothetical protein
MIETTPASEELLAFAEALARVAAGGGGARALANALSNFLQMPVLVEDDDWKNLAVVGSDGRSLPASIRDSIGTADPGQAIHTVKTSGGPATALRVKAGELQLGWLSAFGDEAFAPNQIGAMRLAGAVLAVELSRARGGADSRRKSFWDHLLNGGYDDPIEARDDAAARGITLAPAYVAVAIEAEGLEEASASAKSSELRRICSDALRAGMGDTIALDRGSGYVFLCPAPQEIDAANARTAASLIPRAASKTQFGARIIGGVGRRTDAIDARRSVEDAREAMFITRRLFTDARVVPYEDLGVYPLLVRGGSTVDEWRALADRVLAPLRAYDEKHQTELIRTLRLYFEVGQNVKTAAANLNVHRHTVFYRLRQIDEISGHTLDDPHDQLTLRAALAIDALNPR